MKTNADKDLKQQQLSFEGRKPGINIKQNKKVLVCIKHTSSSRMFYILHRHKQYNRINFGELFVVQMNLIIPKATAPKKIIIIIIIIKTPK